MSAITFLEYFNAIYREIEDEEVSGAQFDAGSDITVTRIKGYINDAYRIIWQTKPLYTYPPIYAGFKTTIGTQNYFIDNNADITKLLRVQVFGFEPLQIVSFYKYWTEINPNLTALRGRPEYAFENNGLLGFYPTPDAEYSIQYAAARKYAPLVKSTDRPITPDTYDDIIHFYALGLAKMHENDADAEACFQIAKNRLGQLRIEEANALPANMSTTGYTDTHLFEADYWLKNG